MYKKYIIRRVKGEIWQRTDRMWLCMGEYSKLKCNVNGSTFSKIRFTNYIYLFIFIKLSPIPATAGSARIMPRDELV